MLLLPIALELNWLNIQTRVGTEKSPDHICRVDIARGGVTTEPAFEGRPAVSHALALACYRAHIDAHRSADRRGEARQAD